VEQKLLNVRHLRTYEAVWEQLACELRVLAERTSSRSFFFEFSAFAEFTRTI
jgi:hypothetical protein